MKFSKKIPFLVLFLCLNYNTFSQTKYYKFDVSDGTNSISTMSQFNDIVLNSYRYGYGKIKFDSLNNKQKLAIKMSQFIATSLIFMPFTHEEGHRSVLTNLDIGSISAPFFDLKGVAKVTGVTDETLKNLRDTNLPSYIRLHIGGLESDYDYLKKEEALFNYNEESYKVLYFDYVTRKISETYYYLSSLLQTKVGIKEETTPELKRDIVGHDIFGFIRHLHRPTMNFSRYTEWSDLTPEEQNYGRRMAYLSFLNFCNPNLWFKNSFSISEKLKANFSLHYSLAPFGDFTEQNIYLHFNQKWKINPFLREYFNKSHTFFASGLKLQNFVLNKNVLLNESFEFWQQPNDLNFNTAIADFGFGIKTEMAFKFFKIDKNSLFFNLGTSYKTQGFIPAAPSLEKDFRINLGIIIKSEQ